MRACGFSLFELLVVMLLVAVVASFAVPAYRQHVIRVNRAEAMVSLQDVLAAEERFYLQYGRYAGDVSSAAPDGLALSSRSSSGRYALSVAVAEDGQTFLATATPTDTGGQSSDADCLAFSTDHRGRRAVSGTRAASYCWR